MFAAEVGERDGQVGFLWVGGAGGVGREGVDELGADEGCGVLARGALVVGVDEEGGGVGGRYPVLEFGRAHDCYDAVLVLPRRCPDASEFGLDVLFKHRVFVFQAGQELLSETLAFWEESQLEDWTKISGAYL